VGRKERLSEMGLNYKKYSSDVNSGESAIGIVIFR
jgi:hypothetical protein